MITLVNEELFQVTSGDVQSKTGKEMTRFVFRTTDSVMRTAKGSEESEQKFCSFTVPFLTVDSDTADWSDQDFNIRIIEDEAKKRRSLFGRPLTGKGVDTPIVLIAFPYNGIMRVVQPSNEYRIYNGMICHSCKKSIEFRGESYTNILYLAVVPNTAIFDPKHRLHQSEIVIRLEAYRSNKPVQGEETTLTERAMVVTITKDGIESKIEERKLPEDAFDFTNTGEKVYTLYEIPKAAKLPKFEGEKDHPKDSGSKHEASYTKGSKPQKPLKRDSGDLEEKIKKAFAGGNSADMRRREKNYGGNHKKSKKRR